MYYGMVCRKGGSVRSSVCASWHAMIRRVFGCFMIHVISILSLYKSTNSSTNSSILLVSTMILLVVLCEAAHALPLTRPAEMRRHFDSPSAPSTSSNRFGIVREGVDASLAFLPSTTYWTDRLHFPFSDSFFPEPEGKEFLS